MKKLICLLMSLVLLLSLAACGGAETPPVQDNTPAPTDTTPQEETPVATESFSFTLAGVTLVPGNAFDADALPEATELFQVPSCAIEGTDDVYNYDTVEVTAYNDGTGPVIYSIYLLDPNTATDEGLYLGDEKAQVESLYGTDYEDIDGELVYTKGMTELRIILEEDLVVSIEFRMVTE